MCVVNSSGTRVDIRSAPQDTYLAFHNGREIPVYGPHKVYPSGLPYFTALDAPPGEYLFAGDLDWLKRTSLRARVARSVVRKPSAKVTAQDPWAA